MTRGLTDMDHAANELNSAIQRADSFCRKWFPDAEDTRVLIPPILGDEAGVERHLVWGIMGTSGWRLYCTSNPALSYPADATTVPFPVRLALAPAIPNLIAKLFFNQRNDPAECRRLASELNIYLDKVGLGIDRSVPK